MPVPLVAAAPAILSYIARWGVTQAIKKYGRQAVMAAGKNRKVLTELEKKAGMGGTTPTKPLQVTPTRMPGGTAMPRNQVDVKAAKAARRAQNEAAQLARGKSRIKKGAGAVVGGTSAYEVGKAVSEAVDEQKPKPKSRVSGKPTNVRNRSGSTPPPKLKTTKAKIPVTKVTASRPKRPTRPKTPPNPYKPPQRTVAAAKAAGHDTFIDKSGVEKAAVTKEELEASGLSLREYLNKQRGLTRRKDMKKGGVVKKTTKAKAPKPKVRGAGIAKRGVRPCKMR